MTVPPLPKSFEEAAHLHTAIEQELERICSSPNFRSSRKSCEFLRYVVRVALDGRLDSLKERSIGMDLLGRDASYDPSSDATVRVRANEVRKRLASFYADHQGKDYRIILPAGRYVPQFIPWLEEQNIHRDLTLALKTERNPREESVGEADREIPPLNMVVFMRPALIALFLCVLLLRQQITHRGNHLLFWDHMLQGKNAMHITFPQEDPTATLQLEYGIAPLIWISGRYGIYPHIDYGRGHSEMSQDEAVLRVSFASPPEFAGDRRIPYVIVEKNGSRILMDRSNGPEKPIGRQAALLTILPNSGSTLWIQGTDSEAIRKLAESLIEERSFPSSLYENLSQKTPTETVITREENGTYTFHTYGAAN
jgi:hypothetical protein